MNLLEKIENIILGHSVDEILFSNLKHFYGYEILEKYHTKN